MPGRRTAVASEKGSSRQRPVVRRAGVGAQHRPYGRGPDEAAAKITTPTGGRRSGIGSVIGSTRASVLACAARPRRCVLCRGERISTPLLKTGGYPNTGCPASLDIPSESRNGSLEGSAQGPGRVRLRLRVSEGATAAPCASSAATRTLDRPDHRRAVRPAVRPDGSDRRSAGPYPGDAPDRAAACAPDRAARCGPASDCVESASLHHPAGSDGRASRYSAIDWSCQPLRSRSDQQGTHRYHASLQSGGRAMQTYNRVMFGNIANPRDCTSAKSYSARRGHGRCQQ